MSDDGGESLPVSEPENGLAPVIPLFGDRGAARSPSVAGAPVGGRDDDRRTGASDDDAEAGVPADGRWHTSWLADDEPPAVDVDEDERERMDAAEAALLRKLRGRSLSIREARTALGSHDLDASSVDTVLNRFVHNGYLDDAKLADQLIHTAVERKGQGRRVIAQALAQRGIGRDVIDTALAELPDDDADRALEFARQKARAMTDLDRDVALRRLAGQLARRGYGAQALDAARRALDEACTGRGGGRSGVRFT
ncbi:regulatory protein RecX [Microbacterium invictum]|uniref:Regulatory protein RecX n=1 Tax=Microbacterium invictum TaxID=515415 RepID=A0AA40SNQ2_9MICO|nr:regulatory protein RecX [Microbacterium invictum]MBB4139524.1 regulatory protein [Microbacterium invictum]